MMTQGKGKADLMLVLVSVLVLVLPLHAAADATPAAGGARLPALLQGLRMARQIWWNQPDIVQALQLKDEQRAAMDKLLTKTQEAQRAIQQKQAEQRQALEEALAKANWDAARKAGTEVGEGLAVASTVQTGLKIDILKLLDDTQRQTLATRYAHLLRRPWMVGLPVGGIHLEGKGR
jgi:Spy/CpxP family protein refolding chaperone